MVNCKVDADVDIAKVAVKKTRETSTTLIGEDTDPTKFCNSFDVQQEARRMRYKLLDVKQWFICMMANKMNHLH